MRSVALIGIVRRSFCTTGNTTVPLFSSKVLNSNRTPDVGGAFQAEIGLLVYRSAQLLRQPGSQLRGKY